MLLLKNKYIAVFGYLDEVTVFVEGSEGPDFFILFQCTKSNS